MVRKDEILKRDFMKIKKILEIKIKGKCYVKGKGGEVKKNNIYIHLYYFLLIRLIENEKKICIYYYFLFICPFADLFREKEGK